MGPRGGTTAQEERVTTDETRHPATVQDSLHLAGGFGAGERGRVVSTMSRLDERLRSFTTDQVRLELSVKERDGADQRTTLEAWLAGFPRLVATSRNTDLGQALAEVRDDMVRQVSDVKHAREPRSNRRLRGPRP